MSEQFETELEVVYNIRDDMDIFGWTQNEMAIDITGLPLPADDDDVDSLCLLGFIHRNTVHDERIRTIIVQQVCAALNADSHSAYDSDIIHCSTAVHEWNDSDTRSRQHVIDLVDGVIDRIESAVDICNNSHEVLS